MSRVVVVGGGFAGLSAAARLAKLRHDVVLVEATSELGGRLRGIDVDGTRRSPDVETVTLPGVFRDLFRKSGRPMDRALDMTLTAGRRHVLPDRTVIDLPFGNRGAQHDAVAAALGDDDWSPWVDRWAEPWNLLRRTWFDARPGGSDDLDRAGRRLLSVRRSLERSTLPDDERLDPLVLDLPRLEGHDVRRLPAWWGVWATVERNFGRWAFAGGASGLAEALTRRLQERKVTVALDETAVELTTRGDLRRSGIVTGVVTRHRTIDADVVVWCAPTWPAPLPPSRLLPVIPDARTFATLDPTTELPDDVVVHGAPPMRLWREAPDRLTVIHRIGLDPFDELARRGVDLRSTVVDPVTVSPSDLVRTAHWGWQWQGWRSIDHFPGVGTTAGVHLAGAHAWPGGSAELIGMATASIAEAIGPAPRS